MIPLAEAKAHVLHMCTPAAPVSAPVAESLGLVLAESVVSEDQVPPFANTAMDGFAVNAADTAQAPTTLRVVGTLAAGARPDVTVEPGTAVRIMTGAPMPPGADAVIMVELTESVDDGTEHGAVQVNAEVPVGNHIRAAGEDMRIGQLIFEPGTELRAGHLGVLCTLGRVDVLVTPRPRVGVISTGDELVEGSGPLEPGQIRDSNRRTLLSLVAEAGATPIDLGLVRDDEAKIRAALLDGAANCDALITSGGVSMGDFDYVKKVLSEIADMRWMQVAIKPAKPLAFGTITAPDERVVPVFGLPGNPVSSMVSFELFARPGLRRIMGHGALDRPTLQATTADQLRSYGDSKTHFSRVVARHSAEGIQVRSAGGQGSHQLSAMAIANALAVLPDVEPSGAGPWPIELIALTDLSDT